MIEQQNERTKLVGFVPCYFRIAVNKSYQRQLQRFVYLNYSRIINCPKLQMQSPTKHYMYQASTPRKSAHVTLNAPLTNSAVYVAVKSKAPMPLLNSKLWTVPKLPWRTCTVPKSMEEKSLSSMSFGTLQLAAEIEMVVDLDDPVLEIGTRETGEGIDDDHVLVHMNVVVVGLHPVVAVGAGVQEDEGALAPEEALLQGIDRVKGAVVLIRAL